MLGKQYKLKVGHLNIIAICSWSFQWFFHIPILYNVRPESTVVIIFQNLIHNRHYLEPFMHIHKKKEKKMKFIDFLDSPFFDHYEGDLN